jgi:putative alpha-1,2-mannosidase
MSAWYVWEALGLYPSMPGTSMLTVNTPLFDRVEIALPAGKSIRISAPGVSGHHRMQYISGLHVDGRSIDETYRPSSVVQGGGVLAFSLSVKPNRGWGTASSSARAAWP